jgi:hypothetical protein
VVAEYPELALDEIKGFVVVVTVTAALDVQRLVLADRAAVDVAHVVVEDCIERGGIAGQGCLDAPVVEGRDDCGEVVRVH